MRIDQLQAQIEERSPLESVRARALRLGMVPAEHPYSCRTRTESATGDHTCRCCLFAQTPVAGSARGMDAGWSVLFGRIGRLRAAGGRRGRVSRGGMEACSGLGVEAAESVTSEVGGRGWRLIVLCLLFLGSGLLLTFRVYSYQVVEHARFEELANAEHWERVTIAPRRGTIFDRNGYALARSVMYESVYAWTPSIEDVQAAADKLAPILAEPAGQVAEIIRQADAKTVVLKR